MEGALSLYEAGDEHLEGNEEWFGCSDELFCAAGSLTHVILSRNR